MRACVLLLCACADGAVTGPATSTAHPAARSATIYVDNVSLIDPPGTYRQWTIAISEAPEGTDCQAIGEPLIEIELWTIFSSAPRGLIPVSLMPPPQLFPAAYVRLIDGIATQGSVMITSAASTRLIGTLTANITLDGGNPRALDVVFDATTCSP